MRGQSPAEVFQQLIRQSLFPSSAFSIPVLNESDWQQVYRLAVMQALVGQLYPVVSQLPQSCCPGRMLLLRWCGMAAKIRQENEHINRVFAEILELFRAEGIQVFVLKGPFVSQFYRDGSLRQPGDIDLFFTTMADYRRACRWAQAHADQYALSVKHSAFELHSVHVELHSEVVHWAYWPDRACLRTYFKHQLGHLSRFTLPTADALPFYSLSFQGNIVYMLMHLAGHTLTSGVGLKQYVDLCCYCRENAQRTYEEKQELTALLHRVGLYRFAEQVALLLTDYLGLSPRLLPYTVQPNKQASVLISDILTGGNFGQYRAEVHPYSASRLVHKSQTARKMLRRCVAYYRLFPAQATCFPLYYFGRNVSNYLQGR